MGGTHKYDLTPDVTHLIVGDYDTPKYRHVARERPDIKAMDVDWIDAVSALWKRDEEIPFKKLESQYQLKALQKCGPGSTAGGAEASALTICLTGFGLEWKEIAEKIQVNGGLHRADLTRSCTHLIVKKPEGKKFSAARSWKVATVTLDWLEQSIERGLILDEEKFDPLLSPEEQGVGAWNKKDAEAMRQKKRSRSMIAPGQEDGARKLRKTASMKLNSQHTHLWGDILGKPTSRENSFAQDSTPASRALPTAPLPALVAPKGIFGHCIFYMHGFSAKQREILEQAIIGLDGTMAPTLEAAAAASNQDRTPTQRFLIVPQTSQPETHPTVPDGFNVITEMYIEKCLHSKQYFDPNDSVIGRPFPLFPIPGFSDLKICSAAFKDLDLNQVAKTVNQLGASFETNFNRSVSVLVCKSVAATRKEKLEYARQWQVPVVSQEWLWECISTGFNVPFDNFILPGFPKPSPKEESVQSVESGRQPSYKQDSLDPKANARTEKRPPAAAKLDATAFDSESPEDGSSSTKRSAKPKPESISTADFMTARSRSAGTSADAPLSERSSSSLNKSPSPTKSAPDSGFSVKDSEKPRSRSVISKSNSASSDDEAVKLEQARKAAKAAEREQLTSRITSLLDEAAPTPESGLGAGQSGPRGRKRQILGRAPSNTSSAGASMLQRTLSSVDGTIGDGEEDAQEPPGTQLDYRDPQAQERRTALMSRLMGQAAPETAGGRSTRNKSS